MFRVKGRGEGKGKKMAFYEHERRIHVLSHSNFVGQTKKPPPLFSHPRRG